MTSLLLYSISVKVTILKMIGNYIFVKSSGFFLSLATNITDRAPLRLPFTSCSPVCSITFFYPGYLLYKSHPYVILNYFRLQGLSL